MKRFDYHDALAVALVERTSTATHYTTTEGGDWHKAYAPRWSTQGFAPHSLKFSDGREWDEHNGWRHA